MPALAWLLAKYEQLVCWATHWEGHSYKFVGLTQPYPLGEPTLWEYEYKQCVRCDWKKKQTYHTDRRFHAPRGERPNDSVH